jgi:NADH dehydrogenase
MTKVLILGGGFAGLYAALEFEKILKRERDIEVTLVNKENFILFTPMLHEVAASDLDITHIVNPLRKMLRRVTYLQADVENIDLVNRRVRVVHAIDPHHHELTYDHLVIALGSTTNFFGNASLEQNALTMKSLGDAIHLRNLLIDRLEEADFDCSVGQRNQLLTVVVAGGGFSGVETIAGINDFLRESTRFYGHLTEKDIRVVLVHPGAVILPELGRRLGAYAQKKLAARGVEIHVNTKVADANESAVVLSTGERIETRTIIWTAGTSPNPLIAPLPCGKNRGKIAVDSTMQLTDFPGVWSLGDCAVVPDPDKGEPYPPTAQHAIREGRTVARNILAVIRGKTPQPFRFKTIGLLAAIGKRTGVANILGLQFSGFLAWFLWRSIYLSKLPGLEKKIRVAIDWTLDLFFSKDLVQFQTLRAATVSHVDHESANGARASAGRSNVA